MITADADTIATVYMFDILLLNGPNLDRLGTREPDIYGAVSLASIEASLRLRAERARLSFDCLQSNSEAELIKRVHTAGDEGTRFILINPAAFTHTSVALRDALSAVTIPFIEIHLSNPHRREAFRRTSYFSDIAEAVIAGFGVNSYTYALEDAIARLSEQI